MADDYYDCEMDIPDGHVLCPRCDGSQYVDCHCGGDLCICDNHGEKPCPLCGGEYDGQGYVSEEKANRYLKRRAEFREAILGKAES